MKDKLSTTVKFFYGFGDLGNSIAFTIIGLFYLYYLTDVAKLNPATAGVILLIAKIWDAVIDPFIGHKSDSIRTKFGKRKPFFIFFSIPFVVTFFLLWNIPAITYPLRVLYSFFSFVAFVTFFSLIVIPYSSLTAQLTQDYNERTGLTGYRMAFSIIGGIICAVVPMEIVHMFPDEKKGFMVMGLIFAFVIFLSPLALILVVKERKLKEDIKRENFNLFKNIKDVFKNKPFIFALLMFLFTWMAVNVLSAVLIYYVKYWLNMESKISIILGLIFITAVLFLPMWYKISEKIGKKKTYFVSVFLMVIVLFSLFLLPRNSSILVYIFSFFGGIGISAMHIIPWSILPDVVEYDELKTSKRREGIYSGFSSFFQQLATSGALFLIGFFLQMSGYKPDVEQRESALFAIRFLLGPATALLFLLGAVSLIFYPISKEMHLRMKKILHKKRKRYND